MSGGRFVRRLWLAPLTTFVAAVVAATQLPTGSQPAERQHAAASVTGTPSGVGGGVGAGEGDGVGGLDLGPRAADSTTAGTIAAGPAEKPTAAKAARLNPSASPIGKEETQRHPTTPTNPSTTVPATVATTAPPSTAEPRRRIERAALALSIVDVDGARLQVQASATNGCGQLEGRATGVGTEVVEVDVDGISYPDDPRVGCAAWMKLVWIDLGAVPEGTLRIVVRSEGREARHVLTRMGSRLVAEADGNSDAGLAPFVSTTWWEVPADILGAKTWYGRDGANERVADRIEQQLAVHLAGRFQRPTGYPVLPRSDSASSDPNGWREHADDLSIFRAYQGSLTDEQLQAIAENALKGERCVYVAISRRSELNRTPKVRAAAPC